MTDENGRFLIRERGFLRLIVIKPCAGRKVGLSSLLILMLEIIKRKFLRKNVELFNIYCTTTSDENGD
jgi:hypothetical protein